MADRVLIVEDNEALRVGIRLAFDEAGYAVQEASSGEEAIRILETEPCHVVVTDIRLGDLNGVDILKKAKEVNSEIEVILMTAYATVETAVQALRLGAFDYIQKPFEIEHLLHRVRTALRMGRMRGNSSSTRRSSTGTPSATTLSSRRARGCGRFWRSSRRWRPRRLRY